MYNAEKYIQQCVNSIINQAYENIEILLVDNMSQDNTLSIAKMLAQKDSRIQVLQCNVQGPSATRNLGIIKATGDYISFIDADDWILENTYTEVIKALSKNPVDIFLMGYRCIDDEGKLWTKENVYIEDDLYQDEKYNKFVKDIIFSNKGKYIPSYSVLRVIKTELLKKNEILFDEEVKRSEDFQFLVKVHVCATSMYCAYSKKMYVYRQVNNSITHSFTSDYWKMIKRIYFDLNDFLVVHHCESLSDNLDYRYIVYAIIASTEICLNPNLKNIHLMISDIWKDTSVSNVTNKIKLMYGIKKIGPSYLFIKLKLIECFRFYLKVKKMYD